MAWPECLSCFVKCDLDLAASSTSGSMNCLMRSLTSESHSPSAPMISSSNPPYCQAAIP